MQNSISIAICLKIPSYLKYSKHKSCFPICSKIRLLNDNDKFRFRGKSSADKPLHYFIFRFLCVKANLFYLNIIPCYNFSFKDNISIYRHVIHCQTQNKSFHPSTTIISSLNKIFVCPFI